MERLSGLAKEEGIMPQIAACYLYRGKQIQYALEHFSDFIQRSIPAEAKAISSKLKAEMEKLPKPISTQLARWYLHDQIEELDQSLPALQASLSALPKEAKQSERVGIEVRIEAGTQILNYYLTKLGATRKEDVLQSKWQEQDELQLNYAAYNLLDVLANHLSYFLYMKADQLPDRVTAMNPSFPFIAEQLQKSGRTGIVLTLQTAVKSYFEYRLQKEELETSQRQFLVDLQARVTKITERL